MPPKQVYGKRTAAKPSLTYANFISPDKDIVDSTADNELAITQASQRKTRRALKEGNMNKPKKRSTKKEVDVTDLVDEVEQLRVDENDAQAKSRSSTKESRSKIEDMAKEMSSKTRTVPRTGVQSGRTQLHEEGQTVDLAKELSVLHIKDHSTIDSDVVNEALCGRKEGVGATKQTLVKPSPSKTITKVQGQTGQQRASQQSAPTTPTRVRKLKAVVIPSSKPMSQLPTPDLTPEPTDPYTSYVSSLLSLQSYERKIIPFKQWSASLEAHFSVSKIAEASFSEVYRLSALNTTCRSMKESVLKLVPLRSLPDVQLRTHTQSRATRNADTQAQEEAREEEDSWKSHVDDVHSEVKLLQNLNHIPGFTNFRELTVLQGRPSKSFIDAWKSWNKARPRGKKSEFPDPGKKASYDETQLWAVIEMQDAGTDVEKVMAKGGLSTIWELWDVFWGVCLSVAKAEEACRFEHRDLHLENICIRSSRSESEADLLNPIVKNPLRRKFGFTGLETTVIDYTLSRADVPSIASRRSSSMSNGSEVSETPPSTPSGQQEVAFLDLNKDPGLFTGDASEEYQYEIYRYMRGAVLYNDPLKSEPPSAHNVNELRRSPRKTPQHIRFDDWEPWSRASPRKHITDKYFDPPSDIWRSFHPKTNLVWAHFILYKLLDHLGGNEPTGLSDKQIMRNVEASGDDKSDVARKARKLYGALERVADLLEPSALAKKGSLGSMKELAVLAMEKRWLRASDVAGS